MKAFTNRSNCVRAARKALGDTEARAGVHFTVTETAGKFSFTVIDRTPAPVAAKRAAPDPLELPQSLRISQEDRRKAWAANPPKAAPVPAKSVPPLKTAPAKRAISKPTPKSDKIAILVAMLKGKGATVEALTKATDWLPHTLRARLSGLSKAPHSLKISRERRDDVTTYRLQSS